MSSRTLSRLVLLPVLLLAAAPGRATPLSDAPPAESPPPAIEAPAEPVTAPPAALEAPAPLNVPLAKPPPTTPTPPRTPAGLPSCNTPLLVPSSGFSVQKGEVMEYDLEIMGMDVGTLAFNTARQGTYDGAPVVELKTALRVDRSVLSLVPLEGSAAALVSSTGAALQAAQRYRWAAMSAAEMQTYSGDGRIVSSQRLANDQRTERQREFHAPVRDFLSAFYVLRQLPREATGCSIVYSGQKAYTVWLEPNGEEQITTVYGKLVADRYVLRYGSDLANTVKEARVWVSQDDRRVPYRAEGMNSYHPRADLLSYKSGAGT